MISENLGGRTTRQATQRFSGARGPKTLIVEIMKGQLVRTDGTTADVTMMVELPELRTLGPSIYRMRVHWESESATSADFRGKLMSSWSISGTTWSTPSEVTSQDGNVHVMSAWVTDTATFGRLMRYAIAVRNVSGSTIQSARLTVYLEIELKS